MIYQEENLGIQAALEAAKALVPELRERATETNFQRSVPVSTVQSLRKAGLLGQFAPRKFGGSNASWSLLCQLGRELAIGCPSTAWIYWITGTTSWIVQRFPEAAQEAVWKEDSNISLAGTLAGSAEIERTQDGYRIAGSWRFASGINHAEWAVLGATYKSDGHEAIKSRSGKRLFLVPARELDIYDTWYSEGLKGTGSNDVRVADVFVPEDMSISLEEGMWHRPVLREEYESSIVNTEIEIYQTACILGPILGTTESAFRQLLEFMRHRKDGIRGERVATQPTIQLRVGESSAQLHSAELVTNNIIEQLSRCSTELIQPTGFQRSQIKRGVAFVAGACVEAIDRLSRMMGATGQIDGTSVNRQLRDLRAMASHAAVHWDRAMINDGKLHLGEESGDHLLDQCLFPQTKIVELDLSRGG